MTRRTRTHPHPGRMAEVYRASATHRSGYEWIGYTAGPDYCDHPKSTWCEELQAWVLTTPHTARKEVAA